MIVEREEKIVQYAGGLFQGLFSFGGQLFDAAENNFKNRFLPDEAHVVEQQRLFAGRKRGELLCFQCQALCLPYKKGLFVG